MSEPTRSQIKKSVDNGNKEILDRLSKIEEDLRRVKNDAQLDHEAKVFDGWVNAQLGFGS
tara:strand:+ start:174 stop:353 length:180 start_codon:yes stop_codon:yes gene_type:complete